MKTKFRNEALDTLVSSEELDKASLLIRLKSRYFLITFAALLMVGIFACFFVSIPIKVSGPSVIWSQRGVLQVAAKDPGSVASIKVKVGDVVAVGQEIAVLDQTQLQDQLAFKENHLEILNDYIVDIESFQLRERQKRDDFNRTLTTLFIKTNALKDERIARLKERKNELVQLREEGLIDYDRYNSLLEQIENTENQIIQEQRILVNTSKEENSYDASEFREILQKKLEVKQIAGEIALLKKQLSNQGSLSSPVAGRVVEITASVGDFLSPSSPVILVQPEEEESELTFVVFISSEQVKPVSVGMRTELELSAFPPTKYGKLVGEVENISPMPLSSSGLMKELKNDQLVARLTEAGSPFMAKVRIMRDKKGDFLWSSASSKERLVQEGMVGEGSIISRYEKLIWLLLPKTG